ncbi:hypothetical protein J2751_002288 [Halorubrum alkaliphilum]|uniref:Uncharacterized protein n=1 Tax=Halorubrum alkaliphilum TaxID=261290 RepID=A0A8T4GHN0_9EURY|nr:hypothetical protein [Halorubrum alkaliphilum]
MEVQLTADDEKFEKRKRQLKTDVLGYLADQLDKP